jgi:DNA-binding NarL/FixJ family response regulator
MNGPVRVMVVDDQAVVREGLMTLLEAAPDIKPVAAAGDGEEAVALCARHRPDVGSRRPGGSGPPNQRPRSSC